MALIKLNVYKKDNKKEIEKTYTVDGYELMFGTLEDVIETLDIDKINDKKEFAKMVIGCMSKLKPIIKDIFPDITDDELKRIKVPELVPVFVSVVNSITESIGLLNAGN